MQTTPSTPVTAAPSSSTGRDRPSNPSRSATRNAITIPGSVAWLSASVVIDRLRSSMNTPMTPAASPSRAVPRMTMFVLNPARNVAVSMISCSVGSVSVTSASDDPGDNPGDEPCDPSPAGRNAAAPCPPTAQPSPEAARATASAASDSSVSRPP